MHLKASRYNQHPGIQSRTFKFRGGGGKNIGDASENLNKIVPGIPTTIKTMGVDITTIDYLRVLIIEIGSTIILMVVEAQGPGILASLRLSFPKEEK